MSQKQSWVFKTMNVLFWVIFIGLCIKTGSLITSLVISLFINPEATKQLYQGLNLSSLYQFSTYHYFHTMLLYVLINALQATMAYFTVKIFMELKLEKPFSVAINGILRKMSRFGLATGLLAIGGQAYSDWLKKAGISVPIDWAYSQILFFAGILFLVAQVYQKGIELQQESDMTV